MKPSRITEAEFNDIVHAGLMTGALLNFSITLLEHGRVELRTTTSRSDLRPGDTVAGPVLFMFADTAMYCAVLSVIGPVPLAVTTDATIHFLRRPAAGPLIARARILKSGARLVVGDVTIAAESAPDDAVAHAVMSYAVPPRSA